MPTYIVTTSDGRRHRVTTRREASQEELQAAVREQQPKSDDSRARGFLGGVLKPLDNAATWLSEAPVIGPALDSLGQAMGMDSTRSAVAKNDSLRRNNTRKGYQMAGGIFGTLPTMALPGGVLAQGAASGALLSEDPRNPRGVARDAFIGAAAGKIGEQVGKRVIAPAAERIGRTKAARAVASNVVSAVQKATGKQVTPLPNPRFSTPERMINRAKPELEAVRQNLTDAADLNLPYALADASPELRTLAGSVARKSPAARTIAEQNFNPRALGQADRAVSALDDLAPITNIEQRAGDIRKAAQAAGEPFYTQARNMAAPVDDEIAAMLQTPAGKGALKDAYTIAANEGRDPNAIGFAIDEAGDVMLKDTPSFETLQLVKRGLDAQLSQFRNPITRQLELEGRPDAQAVNGLLQRFNARLGEVNEPYRLGNEAYAKVIGRRDALNLGQDLAANNVPQRAFDAGMSRMDDATLPEMQRGYVTSLADTVNRQRYSGNPYNAVYGSPLQQQKLGTLFPEGSGRFNRQYQLEGDMAATRTETLGGSPTQARNMADQLFDAGADMTSNALDVAQGPASGLMRLGARAISDRVRTGGEKKAAEMAPTLFMTDPQAALAQLAELGRKNAEAEYRRQAYEKLGGLLGRPAAAGAVGALSAF